MFGYPMQGTRPTVSTDAQTSDALPSGRPSFISASSKSSRSSINLIARQVKDAYDVMTTPTPTDNLVQQSEGTSAFQWTKADLKSCSKDMAAELVNLQSVHLG